MGRAVVSASVTGLRIDPPPEVIDALVEQVAALVLERLAEQLSPTGPST